MNKPVKKPAKKRRMKRLTVLFSELIHYEVTISVPINTVLSELEEDKVWWDLVNDQHPNYPNSGNVVERDLYQLQPVKEKSK